MNIDSVFSLLAYCRQYGDVSILGTSQIALEIIKDIPADGKICIKRFFAATNVESVPDNIWGIPCERLTAVSQIKTSCIIVAVSGEDGRQAAKVLREAGVANVAVIDETYIRVLLARQTNINAHDNGIRQDLDLMKRALGRIEGRQFESTFCSIGGGCSWEFQVYSQWGEDGIIQHLIKNINISRKVFIEFGVENYMESNTRFLLMNDNWSGLVIDGSQENINYIKHDDIYWRYNLKAVRSFITAENINSIFTENGIMGKIGLLSIDIDGNDYWVWKAINAVEPDIVICEYNSRFGKERAVTIPYNPKFMRSKAHYSYLYFGASIKALVLLAESKGYKLVAGTLNGNDLFFVRRDLLNDKVHACSIDEAYARSQFREARDEQGRLSYIQPEDEWELIKDMPLIVVG